MVTLVSAGILTPETLVSAGIMTPVTLVCFRLNI